MKLITGKREKFLDLIRDNAVIAHRANRKIERLRRNGVEKRLAVRRSRSLMRRKMG
jgi:hypothetical protein